MWRVWGGRRDRALARAAVIALHHTVARVHGGRFAARLPWNRAVLAGCGTAEPKPKRKARLKAGARLRGLGRNRRQQFACRMYSRAARLAGCRTTEARAR